MEVPKRERLEEFFRRLLAAPSAGSIDEALQQLISILNAVEDELTGTPYDPGKWREDDRIYPPQPDNMHAVPGHPRVTRFRSLGHSTYIGMNGSLEIVARDGTVELSKPGLDGRSVWQLA
jgi:hypothetical protein